MIYVLLPSGENTRCDPIPLRTHYSHIILAYSISIGDDCVYFDANSKVHEPEYCSVVINVQLSEADILET